jgi:vacuolar-type H+-ATPase subunit I/STV1
MSEEFDRFEEKMAKEILDESHLPVSEQSLVFRLRKRAEIRRQIKDRKSVQEGARDRIADLLEEAADEIERLNSTRFADPQHLETR